MKVQLLKHLDSSSDEDGEYIPDSPVRPSSLARRPSSGRKRDFRRFSEIPESQSSKRKRAASPENKSKPKCVKAALPVQDTSSVLTPLANPPPKESIRRSLRTSKSSKIDPHFAPFAIDDHAVDGYAVNSPVQHVHDESHTHGFVGQPDDEDHEEFCGEDDMLDEEDLQVILDDAETTPEEREAISRALVDCFPALDDHDADFADVYDPIEDDDQQEEDEDDEDDKDTVSHLVIPEAYTEADDPFGERPANHHNEADRQEYQGAFRSELHFIVDAMKQEARKTPYKDFCELGDQRPFSSGVYRLLRQTDLQWLVDFYLERIPHIVQELLGDQDTTIDQFLEYLPRFPAYEKRIGCYLDLAKHRGTGEVRRYVGSATSKEGGWSRIKMYLRQTRQRFDDCPEKGLHQKWICNPDVTPNLFVLALFDNDPKQKPFALLLEGVLMVMFGSVSLRNPPFKYFPQPAIDLVKRMSMPRTFIDANNIDGALNKAWSACQPLPLSGLRRSESTPCASCHESFGRGEKMVHTEPWHPLSGWLCGACSALEHYHAKEKRALDMYLALRPINEAKARMMFPVSHWRYERNNQPIRCICGRESGVNGCVLQFSIDCRWRCPACRNAFDKAPLAFDLQLPPTLPDSRPCDNCGCPERHWRRRHFTSDGKLRCLLCRQWRNKHGDSERPYQHWRKQQPEGPCANPNCDRTVGNKLGGMSVGTYLGVVSDDGNRRCRHCQEYWTASVRQSMTSGQPPQERPAVNIFAAKNDDRVHTCASEGCGIRIGFVPAMRLHPDLQLATTFADQILCPTCYRRERCRKIAREKLEREGPNPKRHNEWKPPTNDDRAHTCATEGCDRKIGFKPARDKDASLKIAKNWEGKIVCSNCYDKAWWKAKKDKGTQKTKTKSNSRSKSK